MYAQIGTLYVGQKRRRPLDKFAPKCRGSVPDTQHGSIKVQLSQSKQPRTDDPHEPERQERDQMART
jgi:hypothetical protein